jgi:TolB-like protein
MVLAAALALTFPFFRHRNLTTSLPPEKSIAVLPFENLSDEKDNPFFADGVQDDILIKLAKIADLKVISRTSVMQYRGKQNVRQIGNELRVSHVLEGTVRRSGGKVHVNAQLVDTRTDAGIWAEQYDRNLDDVFAIETEMAQSIASRLRAKVSAREKAAIQEWPTKDLVAYDLYTRARNLLPPATFFRGVKADFLQAIDLLNQAVARDPSFFQAYWQLAWAHDDLYFRGHDHTAARLALAEAAIDAASRLRPDAGETHLARAKNLYWGYLNYDDSLAELELAGQSLPNDSQLFSLMGFIQRFRGRWEESTKNLGRAIELDPHNLDAQGPIAANYHCFRRYAEEKLVLDRVLAFEPNNIGRQLARASVEFDSNADTRPMHQMIDSTRATNPGVIPGVAEYWLIGALAEHDTAAATQALNALKDNDEIAFSDGIPFNRAFVEGLIARIEKDEQRAELAFAAARAEQEKVVQVQPSSGPAWCALGMIDAGLGRKEEAVHEGWRAVELLPLEKDALHGAAMVKYLAMIAAWVDDKDLACEQLASVIRRPTDLSYGDLKLMPWWDPLRDDPRFEKILEESKNPVVLK